jgi:hypothetical protein
VTTYVNTAEGGTDGTTVTTGNSGGASGDAFASVLGPWKFSAANKAHGSLGYLCDTSAGATGYWMYHSPTAASQYAVRFYFKLVALPSASRDLFRILDASGTRHCTISLLATNQIALLNAADAGLKTESAALTANTWYRCEIEIDCGTTTSNGTINWRTYLGDSTTPISTAYTSSTVNAGGGTNHGRVQWGTGSSNTIQYAIDDIKIVTGSMTAVGPVATNVAPAVTVGSDQTVASGDTLVLTANATDSDGTVSTLTGAWTTLPSGTTAPTLTGSATGTGTASAALSQTTGALTDVGTYVWTATAADNSGATTTKTITVTVGAARQLEPFATATLPAGTWTQTSGPTVTITGGTFTVPATIAGADLVFSSAGGTVTYHALPHTLWIQQSGTLVPLKV